MRFLFVPVIYGSAILLTYVLLQLVKFSTYLPTVVWIMMITGILEVIVPFNQVKITKEHLVADLFHFVLNPILLPVIVYLAISPFLTSRIDPYGFIHATPLLGQIALFFFISEFFRYWVHRWQHEKPQLWKFHAVHHCMKNFYFLNQFVSHPVDYFLRNVMTVYAVLVFDFSIEAVAYAQALSTVGGMLSHGNLSIKNGFWNYLVPTYEVHRWHHSIVPKEANNNYGIGTQVWDHIFGTFYWPKDREHRQIGIEDTDYQISNVKTLLMTPFKK
jgi:sterol desaturase/sphingolipid hydroxylase (fatty acid hydroxylase superfamily)